MRENTGVVLWILVISFGGLWVLQDSGVFDTLGAGTTRDFIVVDGDAISYEEYNNALQAQLNAYQQQTGEPMPPQRVDLEEDRVFDQLVEDRLRQREMDRLGITVTDEELIELVHGDNPPQILTIYFGDGQGGVDRALLQSFLDDPEAREQQIQLQEYLRAERRRQKLDNLIAASVRVSDEDVRREYVKRNKSATGSYFALRYADIPDDSVEVTERDLRNFYNENREDYARERSYKIKYATISKNPTAEDTLAIFEDLEQLRSGFAEAEDDSLFLARYGSERPYVRTFFSRADLDPTLADAVFENPQPGKVVGPVIAGGQAHLVKIQETRPAETTVVKARHILLRAQEGNEPQRAQVREQILDIRRRIQQGEDFGELARTLSDDKASGSLGGDLGWFGPGRMVEPFQEAAFAAPLGRIVGPVETQFGFHLIEVQDRATQEVRLADYALRLRPSIATLDAAQERLEDLQVYGEDTGDFAGEAARLNLVVDSMQVQEGQKNLPVLGPSNDVTKFLSKAKVGDISEVIELNDYFIVARLEDIEEEGYRPFAEVQNEIRPRVLLEKKKAIQRRRMEEAFAKDGFDGLGPALGVAARTANNISFNNMLVPGLGRDAIFAGTLLGLKKDEVSRVVEGNNAVFVVKATSVTEPAPMTDAQRQSLRDELLQRQRAQIQRQWIASLRANADVQDNRSRLLQ